MTDFHEFETDSGIIHHLIYSQHSELSTGLCELACNGEDYGATEIKITLSEDGFIVSDNGEGFTNREDIMKYFKTFGLRHEEGDAKFGRFRIGRGQIMAFSDAVWRSNEFEMHTVKKENKYGFEFVEHDELKVKGCEVSGKFRESVSLYGTTSRIKRALQYMSIPIYLNGIKINATEPNWDYEDEDCKICWNPNHADGVRFYSQGVFVKEVPEYNLGLCADVVTKKSLLLNMARNEIRNEDPIYKKIKKLILEESRKRAVKIHKGKNLNENLRRSLIAQLLRGELDFYDASKMSLIRDCRGHTVALSRLANDKMPLTICGSSQDVRKGEFFSTAGLATVLHHNELNVWGFDELEDLIEELISLSYNSKYRLNYANSFSRVNVIDFDELDQLEHVELRLLGNEKLNPRERAAKNALNAASNTMAKRLASAGYDVPRRKVIIGESICADGWTDAATYIAVSKHMLKLLDSGSPGAMQLTLLLLHEYIHEENSAENPDHDFDFYKLFHDLASSHKKEVVGNVAKTLLGRYERELNNKQLPLTKTSIPFNGDQTVNFIVGEKGLSELAKILLKQNAFNVSLRKSKGKIMANHKTIYDHKTCMFNVLLRYLAGQGYVPDMFLKEGEDMWANFNTIRIRMIQKWLTDNGHDNRFAMARKIYGMRDPLDLMRVISLDANSNLESYELFQKEIMHINGSDNHNFHFVTENHGSRQRNYFGSRRHRNFKEQSKRLEEVKGAISDILNGLCDEDKEVFANSFLKKELSEQLDWSGSKKTD